MCLILENFYGFLGRELNIWVLMDIYLGVHGGVDDVILLSKLNQICNVLVILSSTCLIGNELVDVHHVS